MYCEILLYTICKAIARWQASKLKRYLFIKKQNSAKTAELFYLFVSVNDCLTFGAVGNHGDRMTDLLFNKLYIIFGFLRQILILADAFDIAVPAFERFVNRLTLFERRRCGEIFNDLSVQFITYADFDLLKIRKAVQCRHNNLRSTLALYAVARCNAIKPAHTARSAGCCAEFALIAAVDTQFLRFLFIQNL